MHVFDTTLRDGAQREGITYSVADKLAIARLLDDFGVGFIEGGWPGAMPKDTEFFRRARAELDLRHAVLVAFGATRKAGLTAAEDPQVQALLGEGRCLIQVAARPRDLGKARESENRICRSARGATVGDELEPELARPLIVVLEERETGRAIELLATHDWLGRGRERPVEPAPPLARVAAHPPEPPERPS